jgi:hypothetical protein
MSGADMPIATMAGGTCVGFPDVCKTQVGPATVPLPYPNTGQLATGEKTTTKVMVEYMPAYTEDSKLPMSQGDEAGALGGVVSGMNMGEVAFRTTSSKVSFEGKKVVVLTAMTAHNGSNANMPAGTLVAPSQAKVLAGL